LVVQVRGKEKTVSLYLDHIIIAIDDLETASPDYRALGFTVVRGGVHANHATHNALIAFEDGTYLELLAATGEPALPGLIDFGVLLKHGEGLAGFALRSGDLDADAARLRADGFAVGDVIPGERRRTDGAVVRWKLALLDEGFAPFLIEDVTPHDWRAPTDPAVTTHANGAHGLRGVEIAVRDMTSAAQRYTQLLGVLAPSGPIALREAGDGSTGLYAVHLTGERGHFPVEQAHGVRFEASHG
jgi:catechol 2,3-dioxygenase-like lactoylglutathione lyase family enzyme